MYGILGEKENDTEMLEVLTKRLCNNSAKCKKRGYDGFGDLLSKGAAQLRSFVKTGCDRFIVCIDADGPDPRPRSSDVMRKVIAPSGIASKYCVVIPVHTIEAWIIADIGAMSNVLSSWSGPALCKESPEGISRPKQKIQEWSSKHNKKPSYDPATHNPVVARYLDLMTLRRRCPSFEHLAFFITGKRVTAGEN
jgi:hypothetical protein